MLIDYTSFSNAAIFFLLGHVHLQVVITAVGIGHFLGGDSAFDEADELHGAEVENVVRTLDKKRETLLQVDREDEALGVWLYGKLAKFGESGDKLANRGTLPLPLTGKFGNGGNKLAGQQLEGSIGSRRLIGS